MRYVRPPPWREEPDAMAILVDRNTRVCIQGITGPMGKFQAQEMLAYGTKLVAGVSPGRGGTTVGPVPVFNTVREAVEVTGAQLSLVYVAAPRLKDAVFEAIDANIRKIVCVAEWVPVHDMVMIMRRVRETHTRFIGPNCSGVISPGQAKVGFYCDEVCAPGRVGVMAKSGTLSYAILAELKRAGLGASTVVGVGGDEIRGTGFRECLEMFEGDPETDSMLLIGEVGGTEEERAAEYVAGHCKKPVVAFVAGRTIPPGQNIGHAGAMVLGNRGSYEGKVAALTAAGVRVATLIEDVPALLKQ
jgi:succinyl-CoA synthetase alpha subunit